MSVKIKIIGKDGQGWSVDSDRYFNEKAIKELNYKIVKCFFNADIIYSVWYSYIFKLKFIHLRIFTGRKKFVSIVTNDIEDNNKNIDKYKKNTDYWICANTKQKNYLLSQKIKENTIFINPFYVSETKFTKLDLSKKELSKKLKFNYNKIQDKFLIGSFQRDSLGADLTKPKWHKNPSLLIEILKDIDKNKFILLLAGPRRHFIINKCRKYNIPYLFIGNETSINKGKDDFSINILSKEEINLLYNLIDLYIVTSASEGGPKAIIEASLTKTPILSTPVGFAPDVLNEDLICENKDEFLKKLKTLLKDKEYRDKITKDNYNKVSKINNFEAYKKRIKNIIETISNDK